MHFVIVDLSAGGVVIDFGESVAGDPEARIRICSEDGQEDLATVWSSGGISCEGPPLDW